MISRNKLKHIIESIPVVGSQIVTQRRRLRRLINTPRWRRKAEITFQEITRSTPTSVSFYIERIIESDDALLVQIGSNDGKTNDPLHHLLLSKKGWRAVFVEPVPYLFERLQSNYSKEPRFIFENSLINDGSNQTFYWVGEEARKAFPGISAHYDQLGGFRRSHITNHMPKLEPFIKQAELKGLTLEGLFRKYDMQDIDLLHTDTEGYDYKIVSQLDLSKYRPKVILYERCHLTRSEEAKIIRFLQDIYDLYYFDTDVLSIRKDVGGCALETMKPLRALMIPRL